MNVLGVAYFPVNRVLTREEISNALNVSARLPCEPHYQLSVVKLNSNYMESVDRNFGQRGAICAAVIAGGAVLFAIFSSIAFSLILQAEDKESYDYAASTIRILGGILLPVVMFASWMLSAELFRCTHYPIRFDRKHRLVHVFEGVGKTYSAAWDDVFFTLREASNGIWEVCGHILEKDRSTVLKTFALSYSSAGNQGKAPELLMRHWEFVRRYMEEGPQAVTGQIQFCMPVDGRREGFKSGAERVFAELVGAPAIVKPVLYAFGYLHICARWLVMRSSKIPRWPEEIEKLCAIEPNDPYAITADDEGNRIAVYPEAAAAHGVRFVAQPNIGEGNIGVKAPKRPGDRPDVVRGKSSSKKTGKPR